MARLHGAEGYLCRSPSPAAKRAIRRVRAALDYFGRAELYLHDKEFVVVTPSGRERPAGMLIGVYHPGIFSSQILDDIEATQ